MTKPTHCEHEWNKGLITNGEHYDRCVKCALKRPTPEEKCACIKYYGSHHPECPVNPSPSPEAREEFTISSCGESFTLCKGVMKGKVWIGKEDGEGGV